MVWGTGDERGSEIDGHEKRDEDQEELYADFEGLDIHSTSQGSTSSLESGATEP